MASYVKTYNLMPSHTLTMLTEGHISITMIMSHKVIFCAQHHALKSFTSTFISHKTYIKAAASMPGVVKISSGNYGGKLGPFKAFLKDAIGLT